MVPLGVSRFSHEETMRAHTAGEAAAVLDSVETWQARFARALKRGVVFAADEYYLLAGRPFPAAASYEGFPQHENGIGMAAAFAEAFAAGAARRGRRSGGFFRSIDGAPALGYRAPHAGGTGDGSWRATAAEPGAPVAILTGAYGSQVLRPLLDTAGFGDVETVAVENTFFGGNIGVTGLLTGADLGRALTGASPTGGSSCPRCACRTAGSSMGACPGTFPAPSSSSPLTALRCAAPSWSTRWPPTRGARHGTGDERRTGRTATRRAGNRATTAVGRHAHGRRRRAPERR